MLKSKVFVKKTRRGKVVKIVREHYLRDDLYCGSVGCSQCDEEESIVLSENPQHFSSLCDFPHYVILDTNAVLHQVSKCYFCYMYMLQGTVYVYNKLEIVRILWHI